MSTLSNSSGLLVYRCRIWVSNVSNSSMRLVLVTESRREKLLVAHPGPKSGSSFMFLGEQVKPRPLLSDGSGTAGPGSAGPPRERLPDGFPGLFAKSGPSLPGDHGRRKTTSPGLPLGRTSWRFAFCVHGWRALFTRPHLAAAGWAALQPDVLSRACRFVP